jgi:metallo-beta-lactamase class B
MQNLIITLLALLPIACFAQTTDTVRLSDDLKLVKLSDNVFLHISALNVNGYGRVEANGLVVVANKKALLIDTPWNNEQTKQLHTYLKSQDIDLDHVVITHWHDDCMGGLGYLQKQMVLSTSGQRTYDIAKQKGLPVAFIRFKDTLAFQFQTLEVQCYYPGAAHSLDNIVVYLPSEKLLFGGCMVKDLSAQTLGNYADGDVKQWPASLDKLRHRFPHTKTVVPGHGRCGDLLLINHSQQLLQQHLAKQK